LGGELKLMRRRRLAVCAAALRFALPPNGQASAAILPRAGSGQRWLNGADLCGPEVCSTITKSLLLKNEFSDFREFRTA
jgi:hypothetical protein